MGRTGGGRGTNQHRVKGVSKAGAARATFFAEVKSGLRDLAVMLNEVRPNTPR